MFQCKKFALPKENSNLRAILYRGGRRMAALLLHGGHRLHLKRYIPETPQLSTQSSLAGDRLRLQVDPVHGSIHRTHFCSRSARLRKVVATWILLQYR